MIPKHLYIIIAGILAFGYVPSFIPQINIAMTAMSLLWCVIGLIAYSKTPQNSLNSLKNKQWAYWILFLVFLSCFTPAFVYNQSFMGTLIALRTVPIVLYLNVFLLMQPEEEDLYKAFKILGLIAFGTIIFAQFYPHLYIDPEKIERRLAYMDRDGNTDIFSTNPGFQSIIFLFFFSANKLLSRVFKKIDVLFFLTSLSFIFIAQNRSTLIIVLPLFLYVIYKVKFRFKSTFVFLMAIVGGSFVVNIIGGLLEESVSQLENSEYDRWQAISFYIIDWKYNAWTFLFGNGSPCAGSPYLTLINNAKANKCVPSDIGILGTFFHYGFILICILYAFILKGLKKLNPVYLRFYALWLLGVPTIHHFALANTHTQLKYAIYMYLVLFYIFLHKKNQQTFNAQQSS